MDKDIRNILLLRIKTALAMLSDDAMRIPFSGERCYQQNLKTLQNDFDTLCLLCEITFEIDNVLSGETE